MVLQIPPCHVELIDYLSRMEENNLVNIRCKISAKTPLPRVSSKMHDMFHIYASLHREAP